MKATLRLKFTLKFVYYNFLNFICFFFIIWIVGYVKDSVHYTVNLKIGISSFYTIVFTTQIIKIVKFILLIGLDGLMLCYSLSNLFGKFSFTLFTLRTKKMILNYKSSSNFVLIQCFFIPIRKFETKLKSTIVLLSIYCTSLWNMYIFSVSSSLLSHLFLYSTTTTHSISQFEEKSIFLIIHTRRAKLHFSIKCPITKIDITQSTI